MGAGRTNPGHWKPLGYEQLTTAQLASAIGLQKIPARADFIIIEVNGGTGTSVRWTDDGVTTPTTSLGMVANSSDPPFTYHGTLSALRFIVDSGTPDVNVSYYAYD